MRFPDLCYPLVIKNGESMRIPRLVKPEVKRPSVMPVKAGPDRSDFHKTNLQDFHFKHRDRPEESIYIISIYTITLYYIYIKHFDAFVGYLEHKIDISPYFTQKKKW